MIYMVKCNQCGKTAVIKYDFGPLCIDCNLKYLQANEIVIRRAERQINFLMDEMEMTAGVRLGGPRYPDPLPPVVHTGDMTIKPILLSNSVVGNINQGTVQNLNASLKNITVMNQSYAKDIKKFVEEVAKDQILNKEQKEEVVEKIEFLSQQLQGQSKNKSMIKTIISSISTVVGISSGLATLWSVLAPIFIK